MAKVKVRREGNLLWEDECQPLTNEQMNDIKSQFHPSNTANVNITPYHIYDTDEHVVGEWRETISGVKKSKPVYEKRYDAATVSQNTVIGNITNLQKIVDASGHFRIGASGNQFPIPYGYNGTEDVSFYINSENNDIVVNTNINNVRDYSLILRYIKSTDT